MSEKTGRSTDQQPDEWQQDLNPDPWLVEIMVLRGPEKDTPNASEIKDLHSVLQDYTNAELKQIPVLPQGSRLEQGAVH